MEVPKHRRRDMKAEDVMIPITDLIVMKGESKADETLLETTRRVGTRLGGREEKEGRRKQFVLLKSLPANDMCLLHTNCCTSIHR